MAEPRIPNPDLASYLLGALEPGQRARVEQELAADPAGQAAVGELAPVAELLQRAAPPCPTPPGLEARTFRALERAVAANADQPAAERARPRRAARSRPWLALGRIAVGVGLALVVAAAVFVGARIGEGAAPGELELTATLGAPAGDGRRATAEVRATDSGRVVSFESDDLPILPEGEYYEVWFVGSADSRLSPDRISAGTFHPDASGRSEVRFHAAVDPSKYPVVAVTAETGDGDPSPSRPDLLRSQPQN